MEAQRDELQISIFEEETSHPKLTKEYVVQWLESFKQRDLRDPKVQRQVIECFVNTVYVFEDKIIVNLNLRDGDKPIALSKENGSDIETFGSPKMLPSLGWGVFLVLPCEESNRTVARRRQKQSCGLFFSPREMDARVTRKLNFARG